MPVCIAGMHRSGTSMVARLLNLCGLYLGPEDDFLPANIWNPEGYWENAEFVRLNDEILARFNSGWDLPSALPEGWAGQSEMIPLRNRAADLIHRFNAHEPWGWKDPRNSITLPFWKSLIPNLKVVVCLRNPLEVAQSLQKRGYSSLSFGLNLWSAYNRRLLSEVTPENRVITHFDAYSHDPSAELQRVLDSLGLPTPKDVVARACSAISSALKHTHFTTQDLLQRDIPFNVLKLYMEVCAEAGPVYQMALRSEPALESGIAVSEPAWREYRETLNRLELESRFAEQEHIVRGLNAQLIEKDLAIQGLNAQLVEKDLAIQGLNAQLVEKEQAARALFEQMVEKHQAMQQLSVQLAEKERALQLLSTQLQQSQRAEQALNASVSEITTSTGWALLQTARGIRLIVAPRGSRREQVLRLGMRALRLWRRQGFRVLGRQAMRMAREQWSTRPTAGASAGVGPGLELVAGPGIQCLVPALSLVVLNGTGTASFDEQKVLEWVNAQTFQEVEIVIWDVESGTARTANSGPREWNAPDLQTLCQGMHGRYVGMASKDLLEQNETYLEANLIALETESLAFTVNIRGKSDWAIRCLEQGRFPGDASFPLARMIVHKDCLRNNYSLDVSAWSARQPGKPVVIGKVIVHTTDRPDQENGFPFETRLVDTESMVLGRHILERPKNNGPVGPISHMLYYSDSVLPLTLNSSDLPTVMMVMPFLAMGGAERIAADVMRCLRHEIRFVVVTLEDHDSHLGSTADLFRQITPYVYTARDYLSTPLLFSFMTYLIKRFSPDTLYIANGCAWIYDALFTLKQHYPGLRMVNQVYDHQAGWINRYDSGLVRSLDAHIGASLKICDAYIKLGVPPEKVFQIYHGVDTGEFDPARYSDDQRFVLRQSLGLPVVPKLITFIGRLHPQKRPMDFVELARRFSGDPSVIFLMVGDGPLSGAVDAEIARIGLGNLVKRPFYSPSRDIFAISDVIVSVSEYEGMPLVMLEAQAMGKPVVVTDVGNNQEVIRMTHGGVVVPQIGDISAFKAGVFQMLQDPPDPAQLRQAILNDINLEKIARQYSQVLLGYRHA